LRVKPNLSTKLAKIKALPVLTRKTIKEIYLKPEYKFKSSRNLNTKKARA